MPHTSSRARALLLTAVLLLAGVVPGAFAQSQPSSEEAAFFKEFPLALVYRGVALYVAKDYDGAMAAWEGYLDRAGKDADTAEVRNLIKEAWIQKYPLSLVYDGYARYVAKDIAGAITSFERYIELAPMGEDTVAIRKMIANVLIPEQDLAGVSPHVLDQTQESVARENLLRSTPR